MVFHYFHCGISTFFWESLGKYGKWLFIRGNYDIHLTKIKNEVSITIKKTYVQFLQYYTDESNHDHDRI